MVSMTGIIYSGLQKSKYYPKSGFGLELVNLLLQSIILNCVGNFYNSHVASHCYL